MTWSRAFILLFIIGAYCPAFAQDWQPRPEKAALMLASTHQDDEGIFFGGTLTHYSVIRGLPVILLAVTDGGGTSNYQSGDMQAHAAQAALRNEELLCAAWTYGMRHQPVFGPFPNCCSGLSLDEVRQEWGGEDVIIGFFVEQIRKYRPDVMVGHDFNGEYGHSEHQVTGRAFAEAFHLAGDSAAYPGQLDSLEVWQPLKLYVHLNDSNPVTHSWSIPYPELDGKTTAEVTNEGLACHESQGDMRVAEPGTQFGDWPATEFGLNATMVGPDVDFNNDFFQNIDTTGYFPVAGCMDSAFMEYDSTATVHEQDSCKTAGMGNKPVPGIGFRIETGRTVPQLRVSIDEEGRHTVTVVTLGGRRVAEKEGLGGTVHIFNNLMGNSVYIVKVERRNHIYSEKIMVY
jgi:LmbE family N-acetylglucosaminyl deacetylase